MPAEKQNPKTAKQKSSRSLAATLATAFVILSILSLLLASIFQIILNFQAQQRVVAEQQESIASDAANEVSNFIEQIFDTMEAMAQVGLPLSDNLEERQLWLQGLQGFQPAFREVALVNDQGKEVVKQSRLAVMTEADLVYRTESDLFYQVSQRQRYIGSVHIDETTSEPLVTVAIPIENALGEFQGAVVAEVNLKFMWDLVGSLQIGEGGLAYVVNRQGDLLAFGDTSRVLRGENVSEQDAVKEFLAGEAEVDANPGALVTGINGTNVVATYVSLGTPDWAIVVELPVAEAYQGIIQSVAVSVGVLLVVSIFAAVAGVFVSRRLAAPLLNLTQTATRIAEGETDLEAAVDGPTEVAQLAGTFNRMTGQLNDLIGSLEGRVAARTQRLETVASLSERLSSILNVDELLNELVNQVKESFDYYHAHVYIINSETGRLVMRAGAGEAGTRMKAQGHSIALDAPTSLVARAARSGQIVSVDNVREAEDWLPNPLLPETYSEMAVPVILDGSVVGVLDVQEDEVAGLDEGDAGLLRSLANQVAITIRNARLFRDVETALAEARAAQERYIEQAWDKTSATSAARQYLFTQPTASPLDKHGQQAMASAQQKAMGNQQPVVVADDDAQGVSVVAPVVLQDKIIGALQLHTTNKDQAWSEDDLAVLEAITEQFAQTAENLRLFDQTRQRAGREQTIREITDKLRAAPNIERLVAIATQELGQRLSATHAELELGVDPNVEAV